MKDNLFGNLHLADFTDIDGNHIKNLNMDINDGDVWVGYYLIDWLTGASYWIVMDGSVNGIFSDSF